MLYDLVLVPCTWNLSKAGLRSARTDFGRAIGHSLHMRAFDYENKQRNGVTCGIVPDNAENKESVRSCGVVTHQIANSKGGSSSFAWEGDSICLMHVGSKGNNLNYGIPGPVLRQLEGRWLGRDPLKSADIGFKRFLQDMRSKAEAAEKIVDQYSPEIVGDRAKDPLADMIVDAMVGPGAILEAVTAGTKTDNARRHAAGSYIHSLAKKDYNRARKLVKEFKLASNVSGTAMQQLYYWMDHGDDEEYDYRFTDRETQQMEADMAEVENEFSNWLEEMLWGESLGALQQTPVPQPVAPQPPAKVVKPPACLHSPMTVTLPVPCSLVVGTIIPPPKPAPGLEAHGKDLTVIQVADDFLNQAVPEYATSVKDCTAHDCADKVECCEFDNFVASFLTNPDKLHTTTMDELIDLCSEHPMSGKLTHSEYWQLYIGNNVVPDGPTNGARKLPHATPKAWVKANGTTKAFVEPKFEGLFAEFHEWNWDQAKHQAKGVWPPTGPKHIGDSLAAQLKDRSEACPLDPRTVPTLAKGYLAHVWQKNESVHNCIRRHLDALIMDKGVGWHMPPGINTKRDFIESMSCIPSVLVKLIMVLTISTKWLATATPWQLYQAGFIMPEILKTKLEAHKRAKVDTKRWRLIWQTCITQEIVSRILHCDQNSAEVAAYQAGFTHSPEFPTFGNATGMGHHDEGLHHTREAMKRLIGDNNGCAADRKGWDMSITRHLWMADARMRALLASAGGAPEGFQEAQIKMGLLLSAHVVQIGTYLYQIDTFGIVGSGILSTASSNGRINQLLALDYFIHSLPAGYEPTDDEIKKFLSLVMGDDSVMAACPNDVKGFMKHHADRGVEITGAEKGEDPGPIKDLSAVPFTSHNYDITTDNQPAGIFDNVEKLAWRLALVKSLRKEQAMGVMFAVRHSPHREVIRSMIAASNPELGKIEYQEGAGISLDSFL